MPPEEEANPFRRITVLGLGLMGGSLVRALTRTPDRPFVAGWSPDPGEVEAARASGVVSAAEDTPDAAVRGADFVVLATPLGAACDLVGALAEPLRADAVLTDVVSLKLPLADAVRRAGLGGRWVGAHPMCGGEASGFEASRGDLYEGAPVWIVPDRATEAAVTRTESFWRALGAEPARTDAMTHDRLMVAVSHVPQLTANVLARVLDDAGLTPDALGPGGRDMTRLAASSPAMWRDLLEHAPDTLPAMLREVADGARALADRIERGDMDSLEAGMAATRRWREGR